MAKIISLPISGKVGLTVDMPGRFGQVRRAWVVPSNPETARQLAVRAAFTACVNGFRALTQAKQDAWNAAARNQSSKSRLGTNGALTGLMLYVKLNSTLSLLGQEAIDTPPGLTIIGEPAPQNLVIGNVAGVFSMALTCPTQPSESTILRCSGCVSSAIRRTPSLVILGTCPAAVQGSSNVLALFTAKFGQPIPGDKVFMSAQDMVNGYLGPKRVFSAVVPVV